MQWLPIDQKMPLCFGIAAGFLLFVGVFQVVFSDFVKRISCLVSGIGFLRLGVFASGNETEKSLCLTTRLLGRPRRTMTPYSDEPLSPKNPVLNYVDSVTLLAPNPKAFYGLVVTSIPNRLSGLQRQNRSNSDAL